MPLSLAMGALYGGLGGGALSALGSIFGGGGSGMSNEQRDVMGEQKNILRQQLIRQQAYTPKYKSMLDTIAPLIQKQATATSFDPAVGESIGRYYERGGERLGENIAGRGIGMGSGIAGELGQQFESDRSYAQMQELLKLRQGGQAQGLSFLQMAPSGGGGGISVPGQQQQQPVDWSGLGRAFAGIGKPGTQTTAQALPRLWGELPSGEYGTLPWDSGIWQPSMNPDAGSLIDAYGGGQTTGNVNWGGLL